MLNLDSLLSCKSFNIKGTEYFWQWMQMVCFWLDVSKGQLSAKLFTRPLGTLSDLTLTLLRYNLLLARTSFDELEMSLHSEKEHSEILRSLVFIVSIQYQYSNILEYYTQLKESTYQQLCFVS